MGTTDVSRDIIQRLEQIVTVGGAINNSIWCSSITLGCGAGATKAEFYMPEKLFDSAVYGLRDALVTVTVLNTYDGSGTQIDFAGYLDVDSAQLDESTDGRRMTASTITSYLPFVWVGQSAHVPNRTYYLTNPVTMRRTGLTPAQILRDIFSLMPSFYKARCQLGDISVLNTTSQNNMPEISFRNATYASAIENIMAMFGDVTFRERFDSSGVCYLDFFRVQDTAQPVSVITLGNYSDVIDSGANVTATTNTLTTQDSRTRVITYGTPRRFIVTATNTAGSTQERLLKGWNTSLESAVLADPKRAKPGAKGYQPGMEFVFRRFHLPPCFASMNKLKDLVIRRDSVGGQIGASYPIQVFKYPKSLDADESGNITGELEEKPILLKSCKVDLDKGYFELGSAEDGLNIASGVPNPDTGQPLLTWEAAPIGITFCYEDVNQYIYYDTGSDVSSGIGMDFAEDGITESIPYDKLTYVQYTNVGYPLTSQSGASLTFEAMIYDEDESQWVTISSALVVQNDLPSLRMLANEVLKAKNRRHKTVDARVPYFARQYRPGNQLVIENHEDPPGLPMMITGVTYDLMNQSTRITADNIKPPVRKDVSL